MKSALLFAWLLAALPLHADFHQHSVSLRVVDVTGAVIGKAHIIIHNESAREDATSDQSFTSDAEGRLKTVLPNGNYDICVMSPGFTPECRTLILQEQDRNRNLRFRLTVSGDFTRRFGDTFQ